MKEIHVYDNEQFDLSDIVSNICPICNKNFKNKMEVCEHFKMEHMGHFDGDKDQTLSVLLTPQAKKTRRG